MEEQLHVAQRHIRRHRVAMYALVAFIAFFSVVMMIVFSSALKEPLTFDSEAAPSRVNRSNTQISRPSTSSEMNSVAADELEFVGTDTTAADDTCAYGNFQTRREVNAGCFANVAYSCIGGPRDGQSFSPIAPVGSGGCMSEQKWREHAQNTCCGGGASGSCNFRVKAQGVGYPYEPVVCRPGRPGNVCYYEASITCLNDGKEHAIGTSLCLRSRKPASTPGRDWDFIGKTVCCRNLENPACLEFPLDDFLVCEAYCAQRGFSCEADTSGGLKCNDPAC